MSVYIFLICLLVLSMLPRNRRFKQVLFLFDAIVVFAVLALRDISVGIDTEAYTDIGLGYLSSSDSKNSIEIIWVFILQLFRSLSSNRQLFIFITAIFEFVPLYLFIRKESENNFFSLLLFIVLVTGLCSYMTTIRQSIAVGFVLWAFFFLKEKKYLFSALFILLGTGFHATAILSVLYIPFTFLSLNRKIGILLIVLSATIGFLYKQDIFSAFDEISRYLTLLSFYSGYSNDLTELPNFFGLVSIIMPSSVIAILAILLMREELYVKVFVVGVVLVNLFASTAFIERYFMYATMLQLVITPLVYKKGKVLCKLCVIICVAFLIVYFFKSVPYATGTEHYMMFFE